MAELAVADQPIQVGDGGGQVRALAFVDEQSTDQLEPFHVERRHADEFDRIFFHGRPA